MSKKHLTISASVMSRITQGRVSMKPRWYFVVGSLCMMMGLVSTIIAATFLTNITLFLLRSHGPMGQWRLELMLNSFPWWVPLLAILGIVLGVILLKKYDVSYKKSFPVIIAGLIVSIIIAAYVIDYAGLNESWSKRGPMRRFYQQFEGPTGKLPQVQGGRKRTQASVCIVKVNKAAILKRIGKLMQRR